MKNKLICALALTGVVGTLVACGGSETPSTPSTETSGQESSTRNLSIGVGMISAAPALSYGAPQLELNFATAVYEGDTVVASLVDVYQVPLKLDSAAVDTSKDYATETSVQTKRDRHDGYGMKDSSALGKEWWEQAAALEAYTEGKSSFDLESTDLTAGCSITTTELFEAIAEAKTNAKEAVAVASGNYTIALGHEISFATADDGSLNQVNVSLIGLLLDSDSKVVTSYLDEIQIPLTFTAGEENPYSITEGKKQVTHDANQAVSSKKELGDVYAMKGSSAIGKEWWEQAAAFEDHLVGKTVAELNETDTISGCSMSTESYYAAINNAVDSSLYNSKSVTL